MNELWQITRMALQAFPTILLYPFFWLVVTLVFFQYRRQVAIEEKLFGVTTKNVWELTAFSILAGLGGGVFASILILVFGLSLDRIGIYWLWPVALLLLLIHPRFLCFSYAGGIVGILSLGARAAQNLYPSLGHSDLIQDLLEISLPGLMLLIGILHLTESLLIFFSSKWGNSPLYLKTPCGEVVGAFSMQRFWPLPLIGLMAAVVPETSPFLEGSISMPEWWPLLKPVLEPGAAEKLVYYMLPVVAGLGYADLAVSSTPRQKGIQTARSLALYSITLVTLAILAEYYSRLLLPGILFAPLGHEYVVYLGNKKELQGEFLYRKPEQGVKVLAVLPDSPAARAGFQEGDVILRVNNEPVNSVSAFWAQLQAGYIFVQLEIERAQKIYRPVIRQRPAERQRYGLIFIPEPQCRHYVEIKKVALLDSLQRVFQGWRAKK